MQNPHLTYPAYYTTSFYAYDEGNLGWQPAMEVEATLVEAGFEQPTMACNTARHRTLIAAVG
ncbi:MAG: hypothetical protein ACOYMP_03755 [Nodosilinea sp.]